MTTVTTAVTWKSVSVVVPIVTVLVRTAVAWTTVLLVVPTVAGAYMVRSIVACVIVVIGRGPPVGISGDTNSKNFGTYTPVGFKRHRAFYAPLYTSFGSPPAQSIDRL